MFYQRWPNVRNIGIIPFRRLSRASRCGYLLETSGRFRHQTLAEQRYKVILEILSEILDAQGTGDVKKVGAAIRSSAWLIGTPVVDLLLRYIDRPRKPRTQEMTDLMCEIVTAARKDLGLLPIEKPEDSQVAHLRSQDLRNQPVAESLFGFSF